MQYATPVLYRPILLILLLVVEVFLISANFDALTLTEIGDENQIAKVFGLAGGFAKLIMVMLAILLVVTQPRFKDFASDLLHSPVRHFPALMALHLFVYFCFYASTVVLFSEPRVIPEPTVSAASAWLVSGLALIVTWGLALAPLSFWQRTVSQEKHSIAVAAVVGVVAWSIAFSTQDLWKWLADDALQLSYGILTMFFDGVAVNYETQSLTLLNFTATIGVACSGYEGIGLVTVFSSLYLYIFRSELRFPRALLLIPIGILTIWFFNVVRIATLVALGAHVSPDVALGGFHSQAGWISFLLVSIGVLFLAQRGSFARNDHSDSVSDSVTETAPMDLGTATLLPFLLLLILTMITTALSADFNWLYPLRVIGTGAAIILCWKAIGVRLHWVGFEPIFVGIVVFVFWVYAVADAPAADQVFFLSLHEADGSWAGLWLAFRIVGSIIIAPVAEELAFRGYLISRLSNQPILARGSLGFSWIALIVSSLVFGAIHESWIAGAIAGLAYGLVRYRSDSIWAPIIAHSVTNALLTIFVLTTGQWSLW